MILTAPDNAVISSETLATPQAAHYENPPTLGKRVASRSWVLPLAVISSCLTHLALELSFEPLGISFASFALGIVTWRRKLLGACHVLVLIAAISCFAELSWRVVHVSSAQNSGMGELLREKRQRRGSVPAITTPVEGEVITPPERPRPGEIRVVIQGSAGARLAGRFQLTIPDLPWLAHSSIRVGDNVSGLARLRATRSSQLPIMSYERVLARRGIVGFGRAWNVRITTQDQLSADRKGKFVKYVLWCRGFSDETTLILSLLLGERHLVSDTVSKIFRETGTSHFLAVSGFHLAIICGTVWNIVWVVWTLLPRLIIYVPVRIAGAIASVVVATFYGYIVGWELTVVRSLVVVWMFALGEILGREIPPFRTLLFALLFVELLWPSCFLEPSCELTFAALAGLGAGSTWVPRFEKNARGFQTRGGRLLQQIKRFIFSALTLNFGAWICTAPIVIFWFQGLSLASVLINAVVVTIFSLPVMLSGIVALCAEWGNMPGRGVFWGVAAELMCWLLRALEIARELSSECGLGYQDIPEDRVMLLVSEFTLAAILWLALSWARRSRLMATALASESAQRSKREY